MNTTKHTEQRLKLERTYARQHLAALTEYNGMHHLLDAGIDLDNVTFYAETLTFWIGWSSPLSSADVIALKSKLAGFPYRLEFKAGDR